MSPCGLSPLCSASNVTCKNEKKNEKKTKKTRKNSRWKQRHVVRVFIPWPTNSPQGYRKIFGDNKFFPTIKQRIYLLHFLSALMENLFSILQSMLMKRLVNFTWHTVGTSCVFQIVLFKSVTTQHSCVHLNIYFHCSDNKHRPREYLWNYCVQRRSRPVVHLKTTQLSPKICIEF